METQEILQKIRCRDPDFIELFLEYLRAQLEIEDLEKLKSSVFSFRNELEGLISDDSTAFLFSVGGWKVLHSELNQILESRSLERSRYYIRRIIKRLTESNTSSVNEIDLNRWKEYDNVLTDSLWLFDRREKGGSRNASYWGNFVPQIPDQLLERYTRKGDWVIDPFAGSGTTLVECIRMGRNSIGIDLSKEAVENCRNNVKKEIDQGKVRAEVINADSSRINFFDLISNLGVSSVQMAILHPPYWDIIKFSETPADLSNSTDIDAFLAALSATAEGIHSILDEGRYMALVMGDKYSDGEWIPLGFLSMNRILSLGFRLKSIVVKNFEYTRGKKSQKALWRYRALAGGYYVFKHEYIFIFQKKMITARIRKTSNSGGDV